MGTRKIYLATSWRNPDQPALVCTLREAGHEVYDFRNPPNGSGGFSWSEIDKDWESWTPSEYRTALQHPAAVKGHQSDIDGMTWADTCVLLLPSGRSASYEFGWCVGRRKPGIVFIPEPCEPELMYRGNAIAVNETELLSYLSRLTG